MEFNKGFPSVVKYMGSKTEVLDLIESGFNYLGKDYKYVCDLFAGSSTLSGALRGKANIVSNDVQSYSGVFSKAYLSNYEWDELPEAEELVREAEERAKDFDEYFGKLSELYNYERDFTLEEFNSLEEQQRALIDKEDWYTYDGYYLFTKDYSGTYWSYWQCVMIDSFKYVIDQYRDNEAYYSLLLTCLMYAMAYNSQSTGHYAQYRVPEAESSMEDILIYRRKNLASFFISKYNEFRGFTLNVNEFSYVTMSHRDEDCLKELKTGGVVYADPPYCFVHYSRFYHALATLVRYDFPEVKFKGRYRTDRYQSEYCIRTEVADAFRTMFSLINEKKLDLKLSYYDSDTNTIKAEEIVGLLQQEFNGEKESDMSAIKSMCENFYSSEESVMIISKPEQKYQLSIMKKPYNHSRMGRTAQKTKKVTELLFLAKKK